MINKLNRDNTIMEMCNHLDTDKRYMFLKCYFSSHLPNIDLEGSPKQASINIYK